MTARLLCLVLLLVLGCDRNAPGGKGAVGGGAAREKELEPRPVIPVATEVLKIRVQADEGFMGGPFDETFTRQPAVSEILAIVKVVETGPRQVGNVRDFPQKGLLSIHPTSGIPLEFKLSDDRAIHFVSAFAFNQAALAEVVKKHRKQP